MKVKVSLMVMVVISCLCFITTPDSPAQENTAYVFDSMHKMSDVLFGHRRTKVTIVLDSGAMITGKVVEKGEQIVHVTEVVIGSSKYDDVYINMSSISAVVADKPKSIKVE